MFVYELSGSGFRSSYSHLTFRFCACLEQGVSCIDATIECGFTLKCVRDMTRTYSPSANVFSFEDFNSHHKDWLTNSGGTDRPGEPCYSFSLSNDLTQIVNFPTQIPDCDSHSPAFLDFFLSSNTSICSAMAFPPLGNSDHVVVSVSIDFPSNSQQDALLHCIADYYSRADWDDLLDHLRDIPWEDIFKLGGSAAASTFCGWVQVGIDVYIPHRKYQAKSYSSPWFSTACTAAIVLKNHFFHLCQKDKSSDFKLKFREASNCCKWVLEGAKLAYAKSPLLPRNLAVMAFGKLLILSSTKVNLLYFFYSTAQRCCLQHLIKQNCLQKNFLRNLILTTQVSLYLFSLLELI